MKYAFFGTPEFAAIILQELIEAQMPPTLVVSNPDRPVGRKKIITPPPTKVIAEKISIPVWQPEKLEIQECRNKLDGFDLAVIAAYSKIIPKEIISVPKHGMIVIHPSLLPRWRGATPIQNTILAGDKITGTTLFLADEKIDHGPILTGQELEIRENETYESLLNRLAELSAALLVKTIPLWLKGQITPQIQNENYATFTKKFRTEDAYVDLTKDDPALIERKVRALNPEPGVWTMKDGKRMKILEAELKDGQIRLKKIQWEGKTPQTL